MLVDWVHAWMTFLLKFTMKCFAEFRTSLTTFHIPFRTSECIFIFINLLLFNFWWTFIIWRFWSFFDGNFENFKLFSHSRYGVRRKFFDCFRFFHSKLEKSTNEKLHLKSNYTLIVHRIFSELKFVKSEI